MPRLQTSPGGGLSQPGIGWPATADDLSERAGRLSHGANPFQPYGGLAPHAARRLIRGAPPSRCAPPRRGLQRFAAERLAHHLGRLQAQNVKEGAVLVVENRTGEIWAYASHTNDPRTADSWTGWSPNVRPAPRSSLFFTRSPSIGAS